MLKIAIIGCGRIADDHVEQITRVPGCEIVAACDLEPLMAQQLCDRFKIRNTFSDVNELLQKCSPDVVHITTPPQSHFELATQCLEAGCHVYVEKPFTVTSGETEKIIAVADRKRRKLTVGHDLQFTSAARRMRELFESGYLGDRLVHMESYYCYDFGSVAYAKRVLSDDTHWIRKLPGGLIQNVVSHGIARFAEYMPDELTETSLQAFISPALRRVGEEEIIDEVRLMLCDQQSVTGYFVFSSQMRPALNLLRLYGTKNGLVLDQTVETLIKLPGSRFKSYAEKFIPPVLMAGQQLRNVGSNLRKFAANDFHMKSGMKYLIEKFYGSISNDTAPPIPYSQIRRTARLLDFIVDRIRPAQPAAEVPVAKMNTSASTLTAETFQHNQG